MSVGHFETFVGFLLRCDAFDRFDNSWSDGYLDHSRAVNQLAGVKIHDRVAALCIAIGFHINSIQCARRQRIFESRVVIHLHVGPEWDLAMFLVVQTLALHNHIRAVVTRNSSLDWEYVQLIDTDQSQLLDQHFR